MKEVIDVSGVKVKLIKRIANNKNCFIYLDPPYYPVPKIKGGKVSPYRLYNGYDFLPVDFLKLKLRCDDLTKQGIPFILSNSDCEFIRILFKEYVIIEVEESRGIKKENNKKQRPKESCLMITNFKHKKDFMETIKNGY